MVSDCERTRELLSAHLEGDLPASERGLVLRHLGRCPECLAVYDSLARAVDALRSLRASPPARGSIAPQVIGRIRGRSLRRAIGPCLERAALRRTATIALVVGTILTAVNQLDVFVGGEATLFTGLKVAMNFLVPFVVSNLGLLTAHASGRIRP